MMSPIPEPARSYLAGCALMVLDGLLLSFGVIYIRGASASDAWQCLFWRSVAFSLALSTLAAQRRRTSPHGGDTGTWAPLPGFRCWLHKNDRGGFDKLGIIPSARGIQFLKRDDEGKLAGLFVAYTCTPTMFGGYRKWFACPVEARPHPLWGQQPAVSAVPRIEVCIPV